MTTLKLTTGAELLGTWSNNLESGTGPARFKLATPFASFDVRPGRLILIGGPPGRGKTACLLQAGVDLLRLNDHSRLLIANVEMPPALLLERIVSRLSGVRLTSIADRTMTGDEKNRVRMAIFSE